MIRSSDLSEKCLSEMQRLYETTHYTNKEIAEMVECSNGSISRLAREHKWKRPEGYMGRGRNQNPLDPALINYARVLFLTGHNCVEISRLVGRSADRIRVWRRTFGWVWAEKPKVTVEPVIYVPILEPVIEPVEEKPDPNEWPAGERFDTPARHYHSLDKTMDIQPGNIFRKWAA